MSQHFAQHSMEQAKSLRAQTDGTQCPKSYIGYAAFSILGAWPLALTAITQARSVEEKWNAGDHAGAQKASDRARQFATASLCLSAIVFLVLVLTAA